MWKSRVATITGLVIIAVTLACGGGGNAVSTTANPTSGAGGGTRIWAFSDGNPVRPASTYAAELSARSAELCQTAEQGSKQMQLPQALASLEAALASAAGPTALAKLASTKVGKSAAQAETVATAMIAKANPGGALAALLIAQKLTRRRRGTSRTRPSSPRRWGTRRKLSRCSAALQICPKVAAPKWGSTGPRACSTIRPTR